MVTINETEIKKDLYKTKTMARFSHYMGGNLYYHVDLVDGTYQFPIATIEKEIFEFPSPENMEKEVVNVEVIQLSSDLGTTSFYAEIRGSELSRWISKAIKNEVFVKLL
jgi:hypothetical protein